jgi:predicted RNA binding protein YcfA (HicA-like mRNA interferase family)
LPLLNSKQLAKALSKAGFLFSRQVGSHMFFFRPDGRSTIVPNHPGEKIDGGLLNKIIKKDLRMEREDFERLL